MRESQLHDTGDSLLVLLLYNPLKLKKLWKPDACDKVTMLASCIYCSICIVSDQIYMIEMSQELVACKHMCICTHRLTHAKITDATYRATSYTLKLDALDCSSACKADT